MLLSLSKMLPSSSKSFPNHFTLISEIYNTFTSNHIPAGKILVMREIVKVSAEKNSFSGVIIFFPEVLSCYAVYFSG